MRRALEKPTRPRRGQQRYSFLEMVRLEYTHRQALLSRLADAPVAGRDKHPNGKLSNSQPVGDLPHVPAAGDIHLAKELIQKFRPELRLIVEKLVRGGYLSEGYHFCLPLGIEQIPIRGYLFGIDEVRIIDNVHAKRSVERKYVSPLLIHVLVFSLPPFRFVDNLG